MRFAAFHCNPSTTHVRRVPRVLRARVRELISEYVGFMAMARLMDGDLSWFPALEVVTLRVADAKLELVEAARDKHGMEKCIRAELDMLPLAAAAAAGDLVGLGFRNDRDTGFVWRSRASRGMGERIVRIRIHVSDWTRQIDAQVRNDGDRSRCSVTVSSTPLPSSYYSALPFVRSELCYICANTDERQLTIGRKIRKSVSFKVCCETHLVAQQKTCLLYRGLREHTLAYGSFPRDEFREILNTARLKADEGGKF